MRSLLKPIRKVIVSHHQNAVYVSYIHLRAHDTTDGSALPRTTEEKKASIAILLGDPAGIGPELVTKLLQENITNQANIVVIGEKSI